MRAVVITYMWWGMPRVKVFSHEYKRLTDERLVKKVKGWARCNISKLYTPENCSITFYSDILDVTTAVNIPL
jgi:hypothetical protein